MKKGNKNIKLPPNSPQQQKHCFCAPMQSIVVPSTFFPRDIWRPKPAVLDTSTPCSLGKMSHYIFSQSESHIFFPKFYFFESGKDSLYSTKKKVRLKNMRNKLLNIDSGFDYMRIGSSGCLLRYLTWCWCWCYLTRYGCLCFYKGRRRPTGILVKWLPMDFGGYLFIQRIYEYSVFDRRIFEYSTEYPEKIRPPNEYSFTIRISNIRIRSLFLIFEYRYSNST